MNEEARLIASPREHESFCIGKVKAWRAIKEPQAKIDRYYEDMDEVAEEEERNNRKVEGYNAAVAGLRADNPDKYFDIVRLRALWDRDLALIKSAY